MSSRRLASLLLLTVVISVLLVKVGLTLAQGSRGVFTQGTKTCAVNPNTLCGNVSCSNIVMFGNTVCSPPPGHKPAFSATQTYRPVVRSRIA
jgi:hypothetical protein